MVFIEADTTRIQYRIINLKIFATGDLLGSLLRLIVDWGEACIRSTPGQGVLLFGLRIRN